MAVSIPGVLVDVLGYLTGIALYVMLAAMVWRERSSEGTPLLARRGRLPLATGVCGLIWNAGALAALTIELGHSDANVSLLLAFAFSALGFLPAVVVHSLLQGRETAARRGAVVPIIATAYGLSAIASLLQISAALGGSQVPSRPALWVVTIGFGVLTGSLLLITREQSSRRRGLWVAALALFAVTAVHFGRHVGNESWWVELVAHHASLLLALAILLQDYRFALADLFLKNAIALLLLMGLALAALAGVLVPLLRWQVDGTLDPRALVLMLATWIGTAILFPWLRQAAAWLVDHLVLNRPDYDAALTALGRELDGATVETAVLSALGESVERALGATTTAVMNDPLPETNGWIVLSGAQLRSLMADGPVTALVRVRTVEAPHMAIGIGPLASGRRLLSDDLRWLEAAARLAARRLDAMRVTQERVDRQLTEQAMRRLATEQELRALRAQLNPHFLFNALTTIGYLIRHAPERALETLLRLTSVLRVLLRRSNVDFSSLQDELEFVRSYLEIEHARFEERLRVAIDVPEDTLDLAVPTLLLQPLVENAVKHGIAARRAGGDIRLSARRRAQALWIAVEDSGAGFDVAAAMAGTGVGLSSVRDRLRVHYGALATLEIHSTPGHGTRVELVLPARHHDAPPHQFRRTG